MRYRTPKTSSRIRIEDPPQISRAFLFPAITRDFGTSGTIVDVSFVSGDSNIAWLISSSSLKNGSLQVRDACMFSRRGQLRGRVVHARRYSETMHRFPHCWLGRENPGQQ